MQAFFVYVKWKVISGLIILAIAPPVLSEKKNWNWLTIQTRRENHPIQKKQRN